MRFDAFTLPERGGSAATATDAKCSGTNSWQPDLVIIDDLGLKQLPKHSGEYLLDVIIRRYENRSSIMTSKHLLEDWGKLLCDVPTAGAVLGRFRHHASVIAITGKSYRVKEAPGFSQENTKSRKTNEPATAGAASQVHNNINRMTCLCYRVLS